MNNIRLIRYYILLGWNRSPFGLYVTAFLFSMCSGTYLIALPWVVIRLGGTSLGVGLTGAIYIAAYMIACLWLGPHADRIGVKPLVLVATFCYGLITLALPWAPSVPVLILMTALGGAVTSMFWPPVTSWLSFGQEGPRLSKRLGGFNLSWSGGLILGGWLGGELFEIRAALPFWLASALVFLAFIVAAGARKKYTGIPAKDLEPGFPSHTPRQIAFCRMAQIALVASFIVIGTLRYPLASLIHEMSLGPSVHARIGTGLSLAMLLILSLMGRTVRWHYRSALLWGAQLLSAAVLVCLPFSRTAWALGGFVIAAAAAPGFAYASHQYYSLSAGASRAKSMATHEILLSLGFALGSLGGGVLGTAIGLGVIYPVATGILVLAVFTEMVIYRSDRQHKKSRPKLKLPR